MKIFFYILTLSAFLSCKTIEARKPLQQNSGQFLDESVQRNKDLNAREYAKINTLIESSEMPFQKSDYGFWYSNNKPNNTSDYTPNFGDVVTYSYSVKHLDGTWIYPPESIQKQTYYVDQENLFAGLREGLKLMKQQETMTFIFPSQLAFGYYGDDNQIGANTPVIYNVTVHNIKTNP